VKRDEAGVSNQGRIPLHIAKLYRLHLVTSGEPGTSCSSHPAAAICTLFSRTSLEVAKKTS
jgi:hypothetical protein